MCKTFRVMIILVSLAVVVRLAATSAGADVLFGNLDPANPGIHTVKGANGAGGYAAETRGGVGFTPGADFYLNTMTVGVKWLSGTSTSFVLALYGNASGLPGAQLASRTIVANSGTAFTSYTADFGGSTLLSAGNTYWAIIQTPALSDSQFAIQKGFNNFPDEMKAMYGNMGAGEPYWMHMWTAGFEIVGTAVPEPSSLAALVGGVGLLGFGIRRRRA